MPEQQQEQRPLGESPWSRKDGGPGDGPRGPKIEKPDTRELLKKMQSVDRRSGQRYRQRTGQ
jgi:hypothetical protein